MESDEPILRARDLMARDLITVPPETSLLELHRLFVEEMIHAVPVVGEDGLVAGVVSALDVLGVAREDLATRTASDVMTREVILVDPEMRVDEIARTMLDQSVHHVFVGTDRALAGVVTTFDLLRVIANPIATHPYLAEHTGYQR